MHVFVVCVRAVRVCYWALFSCCHSKSQLINCIHINRFDTCSIFSLVMNLWTHNVRRKKETKIVTIFRCGSPMIKTQINNNFHSEMSWYPLKFPLFRKLYWNAYTQTKNWIFTHTQTEKWSFYTVFCLCVSIHLHTHTYTAYLLSTSAENERRRRGKQNEGNFVWFYRRIFKRMFECAPLGLHFTIRSI